MDERTHVARFGFRGRALTLLGLVWILVGVQVLREPDAAPIVSDVLAVWLRVLLWTAPGIVALVAAWRPPDADRWGFMALTIPATIRAIAYGWSALLGLVPGDVGDARDWTGAVAWTAIVAFVLLLARWPEPVKFTGRPEEGDA